MCIRDRYYLVLGISPFFTTYRYKSPLPVVLEPVPIRINSIAVVKRATLFIKKVKKITKLYLIGIAAAT